MPPESTCKAGCARLRSLQSASARGSVTQDCDEILRDAASSRRGHILDDLEKIVTNAQDGLWDLLFSLDPPAHSIAPVISPTAKNAKYMRAAGCSTWDDNRGGRLKSTGARLCKPINTKSRKITVTTV